MDILGTVSSVLAQSKDKGLIKKYQRLVFVLINLVMVGAGIGLAKNLLSYCALAGVMLHTIAFWITNEKTIRRVSFLGSPFWLIFKFFSQAYGPALGDLLTMISIGIAIYRYDIRKEKRHV